MGWVARGAPTRIRTFRNVVRQDPSLESYQSCEVGVVVATSDSQTQSAAAVQAAMHEVLAAEEAAKDAVAASQRRADELVQTARARARRIGERARTRIAALEKANAAKAELAARAADSPAVSAIAPADDQARLRGALQRLADQLLDGGDAGT